MLLFIDFRKAFDTVNPILLLKKLKNYKIDCGALELLTNYFEGRTQSVKLNQTSSNLCSIKLGVPQGSVLGPLFFSIFINDLPFFLNLHCKLFADDTTVYKIFDTRENNINETIYCFQEELEPLLDWCKFNRMDINWSKTFIMFVSGNRKVKAPHHIVIEENSIEVVKEFKLLGVLIDNTLNFQKNISNIIKNVNPKLYSIKKLFHLPLSVRIQFFKTFILPYFDYCISLIIYYPKYSIQKLQHFYYTCILKLFGLSVNNKSYEDAEKTLKKYGLFSFEYRVFTRLGIFIHKILNSWLSPPCLKTLLILKSDTHSYRTRCTDRYVVPKMNNHYGNTTFAYFFSRFANLIFSDTILLDSNEFRESIIKNIDRDFKNFQKNFDMLTLKFDVSNQNTYM